MSKSKIKYTDKTTHSQKNSISKNTIIKRFYNTKTYYKIVETIYNFSLIYTEILNTEIIGID